jgi:hypothetical protein
MVGRDLYAAAFSILLASCALAQERREMTQSACGTVLPSEAALQQTPRDDQSVELLALTLSPAIVADSGTYERLKKDLAAIRRRQPQVQGISYRPAYDGKTILLTVSPETRDRFIVAAPPELRCLNEHFRMSSWEPIAQNMLALKFPGIYNGQRLSALYQTVPGVNGAFPDGPVGDGPSISVTAEGDDWHYVFDKAEGDCIAGCTSHHLYYVMTSATTARPLQVLEWISTSQKPVPRWAQRYWRRP